MSAVQILIGDDSLEYGKQIRQYLTGNYLPVEICPPRGMAVIEAAERLSPKILICDEMLRDMTVYDVTSAIRTNGSNMPFVIVTTPCTDSPVQKKMRQLPKVCILQKPFDLSALFEYCLWILERF